MGRHGSATLALAQWIRQVLSRGVQVGLEQRAFMEATFGTTDPNVIFAEAAQCEVDSCLDLLFFPDRDHCVGYESVWGDHCFSLEEQALVVAALNSVPLKVPLYFSPEKNPLVIALPSFVLEAFVQRLNIVWQPPLVLSQVIRQMSDRPYAHALMTQLRHARLAWHADQIDTLLLYLEKCQDPTIPPPDLTLLLTLLPEFEVGQSAYSFLIDKKAFYFQSLCKAEEFEQRRRSESMELLILQGYRAAGGGVEQWRQILLGIDRLCLLLFGRTQFFQHPLDHLAGFDPSNCG